MTSRYARLPFTGPVQVHGEPGSPGFEPYAQAGCLVLDENPRAAPRPLPPGRAMGREPLLDLFKTYEAGGVDQLMPNLRLNSRPAQDVMAELAAHLLPHFPTPDRPPARLHI